MEIRIWGGRKSNGNGEIEVTGKTGFFRIIKIVEIRQILEDSIKNPERVCPTGYFAVPLQISSSRGGVQLNIKEASAKLHLILTQPHQSTLAQSLFFII